MFKPNHFLFLCFLTFACSTPQAPVDVMKGIKHETLIVQEIPEGTARVDLAIAGMSCEVMCGTAIKKAIASLDGVNETNIEFDAEKELDHAIVTISTDKLSEKELVSAVHDLHDGIYQVKEVLVEMPNSGNSEATTNRENSPSQGLSTELPALQMPGLMDILSRILRVV